TICILKAGNAALACQIRSPMSPARNVVCATSTGENAKMLAPRKPRPPALSGWKRLSWSGKPRTRHKNWYQRKRRKYQRRRINRKIGRLTNAYQYPAALRSGPAAEFAPYHVVILIVR